MPLASYVMRFLFEYFIGGRVIQYSGSADKESDIGSLFTRGWIKPYYGILWTKVELRFLDLLLYLHLVGTFYPQSNPEVGKKTDQAAPRLFHVKSSRSSDR